MKLKTENSLQYGVFQLGDNEFGIGIDEILDVVNFPVQVIPLPLAPEFILGSFSLRDFVIPLLDMASLFKLKGHSHENRKVVIIQSDGVRLGLIFDSTRDVIKIPVHEKSDSNTALNSRQKVLGSAYKTEDGHRLVQLLDCRHLLQIEELVGLRGSFHESQFQLREKSRQAYSRNQVISFKVREQMYALEIEAIREIINMPPLTSTPLATEICIGRSQLRNQVLPIIDLGRIVSAEDDSKLASDVVDKKVIVISLETGLFGLMIDSVVGLFSLNSTELKTIPEPNQDRKHFLKASLTVDSREILVLDSTKIRLDEEIQSLTRGHNLIYQNKDRPIVRGLSGPGRKDRYLRFQLSYPSALRMTDVQEIVPRPSDVIASPGCPSFMKGMFNLRGQLIPLFDLKEIYGLPIPSTSYPEQVLIVRSEDASYGLIVDRIIDILSIDQNQKLRVPSLATPEMGLTLQTDLLEVIEPTGDPSLKDTTVVFNITSLVKRIKKLYFVKAS